MQDSVPVFLGSWHIRLIYRQPTTSAGIRSGPQLSAGGQQCSPPPVSPTARRHTLSGKWPRSQSAPKNSCPPRASVGNDRRLLPIVQGHVDNISGEHSSVFETHASDIAPLKSLIPFSFEVRENTNPHFGIIKLHDQDFPERHPGAGTPPSSKTLQHDVILRRAAVHQVLTGATISASNRFRSTSAVRGMLKSTAERGAMRVGSCDFSRHRPRRGCTQDVVVGLALCVQVFSIVSCGQTPPPSRPSAVLPNLSGSWRGQMVPTDCSSGLPGCLPFGFQTGSPDPVRLTLSAASDGRVEGLFDYTGPRVPVAGTLTGDLTVSLEGFVRLTGDMTDSSLAVREWSTRYDPASDTLEGPVSVVHIVYEGHTDRIVNIARVKAQIIQLRRIP